VTFAGKTTTNSATVAHAASRRVRDRARPSAHVSSATPLTATQNAGEPRNLGTMLWKAPASTKCSVPVVSSRAASR
jgi:hypothetical protein